MTSVMTQTGEFGGRLDNSASMRRPAARRSLTWGHFALLESLKRLLAKRAPDRYSRRWPRIAVEEHAHLKLSNGTQSSVVVNQLSVGGARVQSSMPLRAGDNIELEFGNGGANRQNITARIVYSLKENSGCFFACGLCFLGLQPRETQWIASFIAAEQARRRTTQPASDKSSS
jgi:PilZ domain